MSITIKKNSVDITSSVKPNMRLTRVLTKEVGRFEFTIENTPVKATCALGDQIDAYEGSTHIFGGTITDIENIVIGGILIGTKHTANDWSFRLNSKLVVKRYADMDPHDIIVDILSSFTDGTFTHTNVQTAGFNVASIVFNYEQVTTSIEKLAQQIGWEWYVDADKDVHFFPPNTVSNAPFNIDDTSGNQEWPTIDIDQNLQNMKNSVIVIGGTYMQTFDATTTHDVYQTDGVKSVFPLAYPYDASNVALPVTGDTTMVVTLAGVAQTIGTDQVTDPGTVQVLYNDSGRFIRFTSVPTTGQTVKIYGNAKIPIVAQASSQEAITAYGEIQSAIIDSRISSIDEAQDRANAEIAQYGTPVYTVNFATLQPGLQVGQAIRIHSIIFNTDVTVNIKRIVSSSYSNTAWRHEVECVGTEKVSFVDLMKFLLLQANAQTVVDSSTVLQVLISFTEDVTITDTVSAPTTSTGPYVYGTAVAGFAKFA